MLFGNRRAQVRKKKKISQDELAKAIGVHASMIVRYERDGVKPTIEVVAKMAEVLKVSPDYLAGFAAYKPGNFLTQKNLDIQKLNDKDKSSILKTIDALLLDAKARKAYA